MIKLISPGDKSLLHVSTALQRKFIRLFDEGRLDGSRFPPDGKGAYDWLPPKKRAGRDLAAPSFAVFRWTCDDPAEAFFFDISNDPDFASSAPVTVGRICEDGAEDGAFFTVVTNLAGARRYYWRVRSHTCQSEVFSFETYPARVRFLWIDGLSNVRDLGGRINEDGRRIKQEMLYRGPAIETIIDPPYEITEKGRKTFVGELGIKTEIDLREEARGIIRSCPLSDSIEYDLIPFGCYEESLFEECGLSFRQIFTVLSDPEKYPVYFHCQIGSDRTGTLAMYVLAALGSNDRDIDFDYTVNSVTLTEKRSFTGSPEVVKFLAKLDERYPGGTVADKLVRHLHAVGVTEDQLSRMREFLTEEVTE